MKRFPFIVVLRVLIIQLTSVFKRFLELYGHSLRAVINMRTSTHTINTISLKSTKPCSIISFNVCFCNLSKYRAKSNMAITADLIRRQTAMT